MSNVMPPLRAEEREALKKSIEEKGVLIPVEVDEGTGEVLDGHHRLEIGHELGVEVPKVFRRFLTEQERKDHALTLNLIRRNLGPVSWAESFRKLAEVRGVRLGSGKGDPSGKAATVAALAEEVGVSDRTARYRLQLAESLTAEPDLAQRVDAGEMDAKKALRQSREREQRRKTQEQPPITPDEASALSVDVRHCDFRSLDLPENSVDVIITDPPYPAEYLPLFDDLAYEALRVLKSGGVLACMVGQSYLPEIYAKLSEHLTYYWTVAYMTPGATTRLWARRVSTGWKPVLVYTKGIADYSLDYDVLKSDAPDKDFHGWGQSESGTARLIETFSKPGQLVFDPFLGGGTTAVVSASMGRRFVGCDLDESCVDTTKRRLGAIKDAS